jgi:serine/threonine protein kinase
VGAELPMGGCCCCCVNAESDDYKRWEGTVAPPAQRPVSSTTGAAPCIDEFEIIKTLGRGSYGRVLQVRRFDTGEVFAMKVMRKEDVFKRNQVRHTITERNLLQMVRHPFIVPLHYAFHDANSLYLVMELQVGGELFFHLRREGAFAEPRVRLYAAEILLALDALHAAGYVYRDLKPENVLLNGNGHVCLSDFGLAKAAVTALDSGGVTFCGTPSYMAPEVLLGTGHGIAVDWWSFGTLIFEMIAGAPPFYSRNLHVMYRSILGGELRWPGCIGRAARALLEGLLDRDPLRRLGAKGSAQVQRAAFFRGLDFARVLARGYTPPFKPTLIGQSPSAQALDTSNFDSEFTALDPHGSFSGDPPGDDHPPHDGTPPPAAAGGGAGGGQRGVPPAGGHSGGPPSSRRSPSDAAVAKGKTAATSAPHTATEPRSEPLSHSEAAFSSWSYAASEPHRHASPPPPPPVVGAGRRP